MPDAASPLAGKRRGPESMSDAESSGVAESPCAGSLAIVPFNLMILVHLPCGGVHANTRSLDHIMQNHRLSLQTSPLLAKACNGDS